MKYRILGNTGLEISEIAFGGAGIGLPYAGQELPSKDASIGLLKDALDHGINFYDTARMYGQSEGLIGEAFRHRRDEVIISTKAVHFLHENGTMPAAEIVQSKIRQSLEQSLRALQTDYLDVFMLHQANTEILQNDAIKEVFHNLKKEGLIRFTGASTYEPDESMLCIESGDWDVIQMPANLLDQRHLKTLDLAKSRDIGVIVRSVLFRGMLTGRPFNLHPDLYEVASKIGQLKKWNKNRYPDLLTLAVKFVLSYPEVSAALIGMDQPDHLATAIRAAGSEDVNDVWKEELEDMAFQNPEYLNLNHWIKKGWLTN